MSSDGWDRANDQNMGNKGNQDKLPESWEGSPGNGHRVVFCTASPANGEMIAESLIKEHLAACVNISSVNSCYLWEGKLNQDREALLIIKTEQTRIERLISRIRELHSYDLPEIVVLPIIDGYQPYLEWISQSVDSSR